MLIAALLLASLSQSPSGAVPALTCRTGEVTWRIGPLTVRGTADGFRLIPPEAVEEAPTANEPEPSPGGPGEAALEPPLATPPETKPPEPPMPLPANFSLEAGRLHWRDDSGALRPIDGGRYPPDLRGALHLADLGTSRFLAIPGAVVRLDTTTGRLRAQTLGPATELPSLVDTWPGALRLRSGARLFRCETDEPCRIEATLPSRAGEVVAAGDLFWAGDDNSPGLFRLVPNARVPSTPVVEMPVRQLCGRDAHSVWAVLERDDQTLLLTLAAGSPAVERAQPEHVLRSALAQPSVSAEDLALGFTWLLSRGAELGETLWIAAARHPSPEWRRRSVEPLAELGTPRAVVTLEQLAKDPDIDTRAQLLDLVGCCEGTPGLGVALVGLLFDDTDEDLAFEARDKLLFIEPAIALNDAPESYRLDIVSLLTRELERGRRDAVGGVLDRLRVDTSPRVRAQAESLAELLP